MAQRTIDFSTNIVDGTAGGASGDTTLIVDGLRFEISAAGNWTASISGGRFNFAEDSAVGGQNFSISVTTLDGSLIDFYDYQITMTANPMIVGNWSPPMAIGNTTWSDYRISGSGMGGDYYRASFPGTNLPITLGSNVTIRDYAIPEQTYSGTISFWLDNLTVVTNLAPTVSGWNADDNQTYSPGSGTLMPIDIGTAATVTDLDASGWTNGTIRFSISSGRVSGQDALSLVHEGTGAGQIGISGSAITYGGVQIGTFSGGGTGSSSLTVTLNAAASNAAINALLGNVAYSNNTASATGTRTISVTVSDSLGSFSQSVSTTVTLSAPLAAPSVTALGISGTFTENGSATELFSNASVATNDVGQVITGTAFTVNNLSDGSSETLVIGGTSIALVNGTTGTVSGGTYIVAVAGSTATVTVTGLNLSEANAATWLQGIAYQNLSEDPTAGPRIITLTALTDSGANNNSTPVNISATVQVIAVNDAPSLQGEAGAVTYVENAPGVAVAPQITVSDVDNEALSSATVSITSNFVSSEDSLAFSNTSASQFGNITASYNAETGLLTLSSTGGTATMAQWQAALRAVTYSNTSEAPSTLPRTVTISVSDGTLTGYVSKSISVHAVNDAPVVNANAGSANFVEEGEAVAIASGLTVSDVDDTTLTGATISISAGFVAGQDVLGFTNTSTTSYGNITGSYNAATGVLSLTGNQASMAQWQNALRAVTYLNTADEPSGATRTISFTVNDDSVTSAASTRNVTIYAVNDAPVLTTSADATAFVEDSPAVAVASDIVVSDVDSATLSFATFTITNFFSGEDRLSFANTSATTYGNITASFNIETGRLTLTSAGATATLAQWQAAMQAVTYNNTSDTPNTASRSIVIRANDGSADSLAVTKTVTVAATYDAPVVNAGSGTASFTEGGSAIAIASELTVSDVDSTTLSSAVVVFVDGFVSGEDMLTFTNNDATLFGDITANYNGSGLLSLTGSSASMAQWQNALRAVTYHNTAAEPSGGTRTIGITVFDRDSGTNSVPVDRLVTITLVNDAPVATVPADQTTHVDTALVFSSANGNLLSIDDVDLGTGTLSVTLSVDAGTLTLSRITGLVFTTGTGTADTTMTFSGDKADINAALNGLTFTPAANQSGTVELTLNVNDNGNTGSGGAKSDQTTLEIDVIRPVATIVAVEAVTAAGVYDVGSTITLRVEFDSVVSVTGAPTLLLETGSMDRAATYTSGSGSKILVFTYTVQAGDLTSDLDYTGTTALQLQGGSIVDIDGQGANLTLPSPGAAGSLGANSALVIDGVAPGVVSVTVPAAGSYDIGDNLDFTVSLSEVVNVDTAGGTPRIAVTLDTGGQVWADYLSGSGTTDLMFRLTVTSGQRDLTGITLGSSVQLNGGTITDLPGNALVPSLNSVGSTTGIQVDTIHNFPPALTGDLQMTMAEGATKTLTTADLFFTDSEDSPPEVTFTATALSHGQILVNGVVKTTFTGAELAAGQVQFRHDGSEGASAGFTVSVEDGDEDATPPTSAKFAIAVTPVDDAPTALTVVPTLRQIAENTTISRKIAVADIRITDVDGGANPIKLSGADAGLFQVEAGKLWLRAGTKLDFETNPDLDVTLSTGALKTAFHLDVTDVNEAPEVRLTNKVSSLAEDISTAKARVVATIVVSDDALGARKLALTGADADLFRITDGQVVLRAGAKLDFETNPRLDVRVTVDDPKIGKGVDDFADLSIKILDRPEQAGGTKGQDTLVGTKTADMLDGRGGNDIIRGGAGNDTLIGGAGHDTLTGGAGADVFRFHSLSDSGAGQSGYVNNSGLSALSGLGRRDVITDFQDGLDRIDLSAIDANAKKSGNQAFVLVSGNALPGFAGALVVRQFNESGTKNDRTIIYGDVDGDRSADLQVELRGLHRLTADDFIL